MCAQVDQKQQRVPKPRRSRRRRQVSPTPFVSTAYDNFARDLRKAEHLSKLRQLAICIRGCWERARGYHRALLLVESNLREQLLTGSHAVLLCEVSECRIAQQDLMVRCQRELDDIQRTCASLSSFHRIPPTVYYPK